jgi:hypothetical protein
MPSVIDEIRKNPQWLTTPLGAAVGLALTHKMLPAERRTPLAYGVGGTAGGLTGYLAGGYMKANPALASKENDRSLKNMSRYYEGNPDQLTQPVNTSELNVIRKLGFNLPYIDDEKAPVSADTTKNLQSVEPKLAELGVWKARKYFAERQGNSTALQLIDSRINELGGQVSGPGFKSTILQGEDEWVGGMIDDFVKTDFYGGLTNPRRYVQPGDWHTVAGIGGGVGGGVAGGIYGRRGGRKAGRIAKYQLLKRAPKLAEKVPSGPVKNIGGLIGLLAGGRYGGEVGSDTSQWLANKGRGESFGGRKDQGMIESFGELEGK